MIICNISHLEQRCISRGYKLSEVLDCVVSREGDQIVVDETHPAYPKQQNRGLGDIVKAGLSAIGITEERVSKALGKPCGCRARAEKLNELGRKFGIG